MAVAASTRTAPPTPARGAPNPRPTPDLAPTSRPHATTPAPKPQPPHPAAPPPPTAPHTQIQMRNDEQCKVLCRIESLSEKQAKAFKDKIFDDYKVNM